MHFLSRHIDSIIMIVLGIYALLVGMGKVAVSKNPRSNQQWLAKYGRLMLIIGIVLPIIGIVFFFAR